MTDEDGLSPVEQGLWQALSQGKRPLGVLVGAGCALAVPSPVDEGPLIPDITGMTERVNQSISETDLADGLLRLVEILTDDLGGAPNVEHMLTRLRTLQTVVGAESVRGMESSTITALEEEIVKGIATLVTVSLPPQQTPFDKLARWAGGARRQIPVEIFTTNYDLLLEQSLERARVPFFDGFVGGHEPFLDVQTIEEDDLPSRWVRLWKLHGSVHWTLRGHDVFRIRAEDASSRPMIHPSHLKYEQSRRMPYLVMQDRVRAFFRQPSATLLTVGYSFRDEHINELIGQGLQANPTSVVFGLQFGPLANNTPAAELAAAHSNICVLSRDAGIVNREEVAWGAEAECHLGDFGFLGTKLQALGGLADGDAGDLGN